MDGEFDTKIAAKVLFPNKIKYVSQIAICVLQFCVMLSTPLTEKRMAASPWTLCPKSCASWASPSTRKSWTN